MREESSNRLLGFLRSAYRAIGEAHRTNPRHDASSPIRLSWQQGAKVSTIRGRLLDISRAGAAVVTEVEPPQTTRARIRMAGREKTPWLEAEILGSTPLGAKRHRVRLKFAEPCPSFFLRLAVLGQSSAKDDRDEPAGEQESRPPEYAHWD